MEMSIFYMRRQIVHAATFIMRRSKHKKYTNIETPQAIRIYAQVKGACSQHKQQHLSLCICTPWMVELSQHTKQFRLAQRWKDLRTTAMHHMTFVLANIGTIVAFTSGGKLHKI